jgi:hypothetical protein
MLGWAHPVEAWVGPDQLTGKTQIQSQELLLLLSSGTFLRQIRTQALDWSKQKWTNPCERLSSRARGPDEVGLHVQEKVVAVHLILNGVGLHDSTWIPRPTRPGGNGCGASDPRGSYFEEIMVRQRPG